MNNSKISVRYAKAFFQLAKEKNVQDEARDDMQMFITLLESTDEFEKFIYSPVIKPSKKIELIEEIFLKIMNDCTITLIRLLIKNRRESHLKLIAINYIHLYKKDKDIKTAVLTTAVPISKDYKNDFLNYITKLFKSKIELTEIVNKEIVGGFKLRIDDLQIDASIKSGLSKIEKDLIHS